MTVTLVGYRGSGKTTLAAALGKHLGWDWVDADVEIERRAGCTIREIFEREREEGFRRREREVLADLLARERLVIAAGGGAVLDAGTRAAMQAAGPVVWLQASVDSILSRIESDAATAARRPALTAHDPRSEVLQLLSARESLYREVATIHVETDGRSPAELVSEIAARLALPAESRQ